MNPDTGAEEWTFKEPTDWILSSPTVVDGTVYVGSNDDTLYAVDIATESQQWAFEAPPGQVRSSPTVADGSAYAGSKDGTLYAVETGVDTSSSGSRASPDTLGHAEGWDGTDPGGTVSGTVTDERGSPVEGATATLLDGGTVAETTTDTAGAYSLAVVPGTYDLLVDADTLPPFEETVDIGTGELTVDVSLAPPSLPSTGPPPRDLDGDGRYEDIDGDGSLTIFDVQAFFVGFETETVGAYPGAFTFSADDGEVPETITILDVQALFTLLVESE